MVRGCGLGNINVHARPAGKGRICRIQNRLWFSCAQRASRRTQHLVRHPLGEAEAAASGAVAGRRLSSRFELNIFERIEANDPSVGARFGSGPHRAWMKEGWRRRQRARVFSAARAADLGSDVTATCRALVSQPFFTARANSIRDVCETVIPRKQLAGERSSRKAVKPLCETHPDDQRDRCVVHERAPDTLGSCRMVRVLRRRALAGRRGRGGAV